MGKFMLESGAEVSGVFVNGETWSVKFDTNGSASVKDEAISATLEALAHDPSSQVTTAKGK